MAHSYHHAVSSARKFGGEPEEYLEIHEWFDATKEFEPTFRHRALRHHAQGIFEAERVFGATITIRTTGKEVPTRLIGEQHCMEDFGFVPRLTDWLEAIGDRPWMYRNAAALSKEGS